MVGRKHPSFVDVQVYDLLGRSVEIVTRGWQASGPHTLSFDADELASGAYLLRLQAGKHVETRLVTVLAGPAP